jgi:amino acid transporter
MAFPTEQQGAAFADPSPAGLRAQCLNYVEVLAQSVSVIAPSTVPAAVLGLIYASAGNGTWLSFLFGMVGLVLVSFNINEFARRSASAGSLYSYIVRGLGSTAGVLGGCALLFGYTLTGMSTLCGFIVTVNGLLSPVGVHIPSLVLSVPALIVATALAARDVQLSAKAMLAFEGAAIVAVLALGIAVWKHTGFAVDHEQLTLVGATPGGILTGMVLVIFAFSGFESSTALGEEAKDPLRAIPRSVVQSVVVSGAVFVFMAYVVILGFRGVQADLAKSESPLLVLSGELSLKWLGAFISIGVILSFFSCTLASINATAQIVFSMARHGLVPRVLGRAHPRNETPRSDRLRGCADLRRHIRPVADRRVRFRRPRLFRHAMHIRLSDCVCADLVGRARVSAQKRRIDQEFRHRRGFHDHSLPWRNRRAWQLAVPAA